MKEFEKVINGLLDEADDFVVLRESTQQLQALFAQATGIQAGNLTHAQMQTTSNGKVVHEVQAAHCVLDMMRTRQFLRAIYKAIAHFRARGNSPVQLLYAGTGPYATLLTPLLPFFTPQDLQLTFLEINPVSMRAVKKLYADWELTPFVAEYRLTDATDPRLSFASPFDIIVSETMQAGLRAECQVPLTRNLVRFLQPEGTFIPQVVELAAYLVGKQDPLDPSQTEKQHLGSAYRLDFRQVPPPDVVTTLDIPTDAFRHLQIFTTLHLFEEIKLLPFQSGLTIPLTLQHFTASLPERLHFQYREGETPELHVLPHVTQSL